MVEFLGITDIFIFIIYFVYGCISIVNNNISIYEVFNKYLCNECVYEY